MNEIGEEDERRMAEDADWAMRGESLGKIRERVLAMLRAAYNYGEAAEQIRQIVAEARALKSYF
jgi:hypothetical protein